MSCCASVVGSTLGKQNCMGMGMSDCEACRRWHGGHAKDGKCVSPAQHRRQFPPEDPTRVRTPGGSNQHNDSAFLIPPTLKVLQWPYTGGGGGGNPTLDPPPPRSSPSNV